jgi:hypothetical protein
MTLAAEACAADFKTRRLTAGVKAALEIEDKA